MQSNERPRILIVDDEEAILETMTFTFQDSYDVLTATDGAQALDILDHKSPISVLLTDQRMPGMTGVELLREAYKRHPETVRIILTGFADSDATIQAINDGHVYAYLSKPWEPVELKHVMKRAVEHHLLTCENKRLLENFSQANVFLEAVMNRLESGAIALDAQGVVQAVNQPARKMIEIRENPVGDRIVDLLAERGMQNVGAAVQRVSKEQGGSFEDLEVRVASTSHRLRLSSKDLEAADGSNLGRVIFFKEISHEPLRRCFEEEITSLSQHDGDLRERLGESLTRMTRLVSKMGTSGITSPGMAQLTERVSRARTAIQSWLEVDDMMSREDYPDAQLLVDRMRLANSRWPNSDQLPERARNLAERVEAYYESGENPKTRVL